MKIELTMRVYDDDHEDHEARRMLREAVHRSHGFMDDAMALPFGVFKDPGNYITEDHLFKARETLTEIARRVKLSKGRMRLQNSLLPPEERNEQAAVEWEQEQEALRRAVLDARDILEHWRQELVNARRALKVGVAALHAIQKESR